MRQHRFYKDKYSFMRERSRDWEEKQDDGAGNAVGRTVLAAIIYRENDFRNAIRLHFNNFLNYGIWNPKRHPDCLVNNDFSRDHTVWFVIWLKYFTNIHIALKIPYRISEKFVCGVHVWLWIRAVAKDRWWNNFIHWLLCEVWLTIVGLWDSWLIRRAGIKSVHYKDFKKVNDEDLNNRELFACNNLMMPGYAVETLAWMVHCLDDGWFKNRLRKKVIPLVEKSNWLVRILMDNYSLFNIDEIREIDQYTGMDGYRWSRRLDKTTNVDLYPLEGEQPPYNMDVDVLKADLEWEDL